MHAPIATQRQRSPGTTANDPGVTHVARSSRMAASQSRATPTSSGLADARSASTVITDPLVPQKIASSSVDRRRTEGGLFMKIGFIGIGAMGQPMLANLVKKGHSVVAYDVAEAALVGAVRVGAARTGSAAAAARDSELVITVLPSSSHVESAYLAAGGVLEGLAAGRLCIDMSTIDPSVSRRVAEAVVRRGARFIDAPVSGGVPRAVDGTLAIMVGGDARDFEEARPVLSAMGANIIHVGPVGSGEVAKLCNNLIAGVAAVAVSEAFRIAEGFGVDPKVLTDVIAK